MGATLDSIVAVNISLAAAAVQQKGFGRGLILGGSNRFQGGVLWKIYSTPAAMITDGFLTSDPEYKAAVAYFSQQISPPDVMVGYASADVAQVETITPTAVDLATYTVTINGVVSSFTAGSGTTATLIVTGLKAAIAAQSPALPVVTSGSTTLILTATPAGDAFTCSVGTNLVKVDTTPDAGPDTALTAIQAQGGRAWYGLILCSRTASDIEVAAAWIEANTYDYIFIGCSSDAGVLTSSSTDVASVLMGKNYLRTGLLWSDDQADFPDAAWEGYQFPQVPGSSNWAYNALAGITPTAESVLTDTAINNINAKNANYYLAVGITPVTQPGKMAGGQWIDVVIGRDWLKANIQQAIFQVLVTRPKVGFDDDGIGILANALRGVLRQGVANGILEAGSIDINVPLASSFASGQKATRALPSIPWSATLVGAINTVTITGNIAP